MVGYLKQSVYISKLQITSILLLAGIIYVITMPIEFCITDAAVEMREAQYGGVPKLQHSIYSVQQGQSNGM